MFRLIFHKPVALGLSSLAVCILATAWLVLSVSSASRSSQQVFINSLGETDSVRVISLTTNDVVYNPADDKLYTSIPSSAGSTGNSIRQIDPRTNEVGAPVWVGSEPNKLAMANDGQTLYVSLYGAASVRRFNTSTQSPGLQFPLDYNSSGRFNTQDLAVSPDNPNIVVVTRHYDGSSYNGAGVAVFDNGTQLPQAITTTSSDQFLAFSASGSTLYGSGRYSGLQTMNVTANGVTVANSSQVINASQIKFGNGLIFSSDGHVVDAETKILLGRFPQIFSTAFVPDTTVGRCFFAINDPQNPSIVIIKAFDINTFTEIGSIAIPNAQGNPASMVRWGPNGLAFRTTGGQLFVVQTTLIPSKEPIPTPTVTPTPMVTPTPTPFETNMYALPLRTKNLIFHQPSGKIYASVPSTHGINGNSIAKIEPTTGIVEQTVWVGSEPNKLALGNDANTLYVGLDGAREVRKFDIASGTTGIQFQGGILGSDGPLQVRDIAVSPLDPNTVAVARYSTDGSYNRTVAVFDSGVTRPLAAGASGAVAYSDSASLLYGSRDNGELEIMTVAGTGITSVSRVPFTTTNQLRYLNGRLYGASGFIIDPSTSSMIGRFAIGDVFLTNRPFVIDEANQRIFFILDLNDRVEIRAFDTNTFLRVGSITFQGLYAEPTDIERWGANGLAFSTLEGSTYILQSKLVDASIPVPTTGPSPTPTPTPQNSPVFMRRLNFPNNEIIFNPVDSSLYASIPGVAGAGLGNTLTRVNPATGEIVSSTFIGSEPNKLAISDDGATIYASLDGANAIRRFDTSTQQAGLQFIPANNSYPTRDIAVRPGSPQTVAVSAGNGYAAIYDDGVKRPNSPNTGAIGPLEFNGTPDILYGYDSLSSGFTLYKFGVNPNGLSLLSSVSHLVSGYYSNLKYSDGRLYDNSGRVVDPQTNRIVGTLRAYGNSIAVDASLGRAFILSDNEISVFDTNTFNRIGTLPIQNNYGTASSLVRWGTNGLAFRTQVNNQTYLNILQSGLVGPGVPVPTGIQLQSASYSGSENNSMVEVTVTRSGEVNVPLTVNYATANGSAVAGTDYTPVNGVLSFDSGTSSRIITIPILNDNVFETAESFTLNLSGAIGQNVYLLSPSSATINISDNDSYPAISGSDTSVNESGAGRTAIAYVTVGFPNPSSQIVSVSYATANGTAIAGIDFLNANSTLTFNPGETTKTVAITVNGDSIREGNETFFVNLFNSTNGSISDFQARVTIVDFVPPGSHPFDFDGDGKTDISIFRPGLAEWWINRSSNGTTGAFQFGASTDKIAPGDFTGDGKTDVAFWRPSTGEWFILRSEDSSFFAFPFGSDGDIPVPSDYDNDGKTDAAVYRPSVGQWFVLQSGGGTTITQFGVAGDQPVVADYDGDGKADIGIFRPGSGEWWIQRSTTGLLALQFGSSTDKAVQGDYTGDGKADVAFWRPSTGEWFILRSEDLSFFSFPFGTTGDLPVPGDYDGDGKFDAGVFRPSQSTWFINRTTAGTLITQFGANGDSPIPNVFVP